MTYKRERVVNERIILHKGWMNGKEAKTKNGCCEGKRERQRGRRERDCVVFWELVCFVRVFFHYETVSFVTSVGCFKVIIDKSIKR